MWNSNPTTTTTVPIHSTSSSTNTAVNQPKHDIFVGNLAFTTTEEQIHQAFSEIGHVIKVRMVSDIETGKPRGFAFVEFEDPQAALAAIRNMNDYELNGRKLRVNFSNSSHLETLAGQLGMDLSAAGGGGSSGGNKDGTGNTTVGGGGGEGTGMASTGGVSMGTTAASASAAASNELGTQAIANALKNMTKGEMYDIIAQLKLLADQNPEEARRIISSHPQLPEAILYLMSQLDMIKAPLQSTPHGGIGGFLPPPPPPGSLLAASSGAGGGGVGGMAMGTTTTGMAPPPPPVGMPGRMVAPPPPPPTHHVGVGAGRVDPRMAAAPASGTGGRQDPRMAMMGAGGGGGTAAAAVRQDPRAAAAAAAAAQPTAAQSQQQKVMPLPMMGVAGLDPSLVQQVMGLTQAQIQQLPLEKQSSILALRQQIANAMSAMGGGGGGGGASGGAM